MVSWIRLLVAVDDLLHLADVGVQLARTLVGVEIRPKSAGRAPLLV